PCGEDLAAARVEFREDVVEQKKRRDARALLDRLGLGEEESKERQPLLALGAEAPEVAAAGGEDDVVEMRPQRGGSAPEVAIKRCGEALRRRRIALVAKRDFAEAQFGCARFEGWLEQRERLETSGDELRAKRGDALAPRLDRVAARDVRGGTPKCRV